jgi:HlyD family secretion protein
MRLNKLIFWAPVLLFLTSCHTNKETFDASGTFEATEVIVSAQATGIILAFKVDEGQDVKAGANLGFIDTIQLDLRKKQLQASIQAAQTRKPDVEVQLAALEQQLTTARSEKHRLENLVKANAANQKQLDDLISQIEVLTKQLKATRTTLESSTSGINKESSAMKIQVDQINDQLRRSYISSPIDGTLLVKYAETGELAIQGKSLFKVADMSQMILRVYVTADQLAKLKLGQHVDVNAELGTTDNKAYKGTVTWISAKSEFTPKTIQTRDERANLVYAVKVSVKNDGILKIGMYGGIHFNQDKK